MNIKREAGVRDAAVGPGSGSGSGVGVTDQPQGKQRLERPRLYAVLLHNDDYTPMDFVVGVLREVFHKSEIDAVEIMLCAHRSGHAVAGVFSREVAEMKVDETVQRATTAGFPLLATLSPERIP